jgi:hypothetical protein
VKPPPRVRADSPNQNAGLGFTQPEAGDWIGHQGASFERNDQGVLIAFIPGSSGRPIECPIRAGSLIDDNAEPHVGMMRHRQVAPTA